MKRKPFATVIFTLLLSAVVTAAEAVKLPPKEKFHLFLLVGQSNMAGRGTVTPEDQKPHPQVVMQNQAGEWIPAIDPIHYDKPGIAGVGPARSFANQLAGTEPGITIGLIPAACGGSPISTWKKGGFWEQTNSHPYDDALKRARLAMRDGTLKGILFHQGESDCTEAASKLYHDRLVALLKSLRFELDAPDVPIVIGQLSRFPGETWNEAKTRVDAAQQLVAKELPKVAFVSSEGLTSNPDKIHFDSASQREFGKRYAQAYRQLIAGEIPLCSLTGGKLSELTGAQVLRAANVEQKDDALLFNGVNSILTLKLPKTLKTFTLVADVVVSRLPDQEGALFARPGFHNMLSIGKSGGLRFTIFGADKKTLRVARSENVVVPGIRCRIAAVVEERSPEETRLTLYINGLEEGRATLRGAVYPYGDTLSFGAATPGGEHAFPLAFRLLNFRLFDRVLNGRETFAL